MSDLDPGLPRAMPIARAIAWSGLSRSALYRYAGDQRLTLLKSGRTTLVETASLAALVDSLPTATITPSRPTKAGA